MDVATDLRRTSRLETAFSSTLTDLSRVFCRCQRRKRAMDQHRSGQSDEWGGRRGEEGRKEKEPRLTSFDLVHRLIGSLGRDRR